VRDAASRLERAAGNGSVEEGAGLVAAVESELGRLIDAVRAAGIVT
jgi:hypothetical protein